MGEIREGWRPRGARAGTGAGPGGPGDVAAADSVPVHRRVRVSVRRASARAEGVTASVRAMNIGGMGERAPAASSGTAAEADSSGDRTDGFGARAGSPARRRARGGRSARARWGWVARGDEFSVGGSGMTSHASAGYSDDEFEAAVNGRRAGRRIAREKETPERRAARFSTIRGSCLLTAGDSISRVIHPEPGSYDSNPQILKSRISANDERTPSLLRV